jgi:sRNA-binding protein
MAYQRTLMVAGAVRLDLDGNPAGEVTEEERAWARIKFEHLKAKLKAKAVRC